NDDRSGGACPVEDEDQNVLRLRCRVRCRTQHPYLPGLPWPAGRAASHEPGSAEDDGADRARLQMRYWLNLRVRSEKLCLSGHAEELPNLAIRIAAVSEWRSSALRPGLSQGRPENYPESWQENRPHSDSSGRRCSEEFSFRIYQRNRFQPRRHTIDGDRVPT